MSSRRFRLERGLTMVEMLLFIVVVGIAVAGILSAMTFNTARSADPLVRKQALAIAESLLEEIELMPYTICDPTDPNAGLPTTLAASDCTSEGSVENLGPETGEGRYSAASPFNNVNDYNEFSMGPGIRQIGSGTLISGLENYSATVNVSPVQTAGVPAAASLQIDVTVSGPGGAVVRLTGYRLQYAPRSP